MFVFALTIFSCFSLRSIDAINFILIHWLLCINWIYSRQFAHLQPLISLAFPFSYYAFHLSSTFAFQFVIMFYSLINLNSKYFWIFRKIYDDRKNLNRSSSFFARNLFSMYYHIFPIRRSKRLNT